MVHGQGDRDGAEDPQAARSDLLLLISPVRCAPQVILNATRLHHFLEYNMEMGDAADAVVEFMESSKNNIIKFFAKKGENGVKALETVTEALKKNKSVNYQLTTSFIEWVREVTVNFMV